MADYNVTIPISKADKDGRWIVRGKAAGLGIDRENQVLRPSAIERLAKQINETTIPAKDHHLRNSIAEDLGTVISATVTEDFELDVEVELDKNHPTSQWLWKALDDKKQFGMSIGGNSNEFKLEQEEGKTVLAVYDVNLNEVSFTTRPMWSHSFGTVVKKAIDAERSSVVEGMSMDPEDVVVDEPTADEDVVGPVEDVTSAPETVTEEAEPVKVEKAVSADTKKESNKLAKVAKMFDEIGGILKELGITVEEPAEDSVAEALPVEKSDSVPTVDDRFVKMEKALQETTEALKAQTEQLEILKSQIPDNQVPGVLVRTTPVDELRDHLASLDPRDRLRVGLAVAHGEIGKLR